MTHKFFLFYFVPLFFLSFGLNAQNIPVNKKYVLHKKSNPDGKSFSYDTAWIYYKLMISAIDLTEEDTVWVDGRHQEIKIKKNKDYTEQFELTSAKKNLMIQQDQIKLKSDSILHIKKNRDDLDIEIKKMTKIKPLQLLQYSTIGKQKWTSMNLSENDLKSISNDFILANSEEEWENALKLMNPAFCYHRDDKNRSNGVLLNLFGLTLLNKKIEELKSEWRLPEQSDFEDLLTTLKNVKGTSVVSMLTSSTELTPAWKNPGIDLFNMHLIPLSYRRNNSTKWYGQTETTLYCLYKDDLLLTSTLKMVEINDSNEDKNNLIIKSKDITGEDKNIGIYVRLIKK
jgi:uncharacterized protein (TIGR02145 family)